MSAVLSNLLIILVVLAIVASILVYLYNAKKRGETCIGCPYAKQCGGKCSGGCESGHHSNEAT